MAYRIKDYRETLGDAVKAAMRSTGGRVVTNAEVVDLVRRRRHLERHTSVYTALAELTKRGLVEHVKKGHWRWIGDE